MDAATFMLRDPRSITRVLNRFSKEQLLELGELLQWTDATKHISTTKKKIVDQVIEVRHARRTARACLTRGASAAGVFRGWHVDESEGTY